MPQNIYDEHLYLKPSIFFFNVILEGGVLPVIWKIKSPIIIYPLDGGGFAVNIFGERPPTPERLHAVKWKLGERLQDR